MQALYSLHLISHILTSKALLMLVQTDKQIYKHTNIYTHFLENNFSKPQPAFGRLRVHTWFKNVEIPYLVGKRGTDSMVGVICREYSTLCYSEEKSNQQDGANRICLIGRISLT